MTTLLADTEVEAQAYRQLKLCEFDLEEVVTYLKTRRLTVEIADDRVAEYLAIRAQLLKLAETARQLLREVTGPGHHNDRPEDCPCQACSDRVDRWRRDYQEVAAAPKTTRRPTKPIPAEADLTASTDFQEVRRGR